MGISNFVKLGVIVGGMFILATKGQEIGQAIGSGVGGAISGVASGVTSGFTQAINPFFQQFGQFQSDAERNSFIKQADLTPEQEKNIESITTTTTPSGYDVLKALGPLFGLPGLALSSTVPKSQTQTVTFTPIGGPEPPKWEPPQTKAEPLQNAVESFYAGKTSIQEMNTAVSGATPEERWTADIQSKGYTIIAGAKVSADEYQEMKVSGVI